MFRQHSKPMGLIKSRTIVAHTDVMAFKQTKHPPAVPSVWGLILTSGDTDLTTVHAPVYRVPTETLIISSSDLPVSSVHPVTFHANIYSLSQHLLLPHCQLTVKTNKTQSDVLESFWFDAWIYNAFSFLIIYTVLYYFVNSFNCSSNTL